VTSVYPFAVDRFLRGQIDVDSDTFKLQLVGAYIRDDTDTVLADVAPFLIGTAQTIAVTSVAAGEVYATTPVTFPAVPAGPSILALVLYVDDADDHLIACYDRRGDLVPLDVVPNGGELTFTFDLLFKL
jgi:hypothetical protein